MKTVVCHPCLGTGLTGIDNNRKRIRVKGKRDKCRYCCGAGVLVSGSLRPIPRLDSSPQQAVDMTVIGRVCDQRKHGGWSVPDAFADAIKAHEAALWAELREKNRLAAERREAAGC